MKFDEFFKEATGFEFGPYDYQARLADHPWPDVLDIPTGMGKTAAVMLSWLYKRRILKDLDTPRRLVYCLPMRVLVEQTERNLREWLTKLDFLGNSGDGQVSVHLLMGGEADVRRANWALYPEEDAILIGTQDMLLSRALMRGYGMSRYQWPVHFALLHNDVLWVYDEVQLMGPALQTSTQLEAFRRDSDTGRPSRSLWVSATMHEEWLGSVNFRKHVDELNISRLTNQDRNDPSVKQRLNAVKSIKRADTVLHATNSKQQAAGYIAALTDEVAIAHQPGSQTLIIMNRVERAQALYRSVLKNLPDVDCLLLHARFRSLERRAIERQLHNDDNVKEGRIIIATQAIEAGVDLSSRTLFTELAPWSSLVQRFGRCNRAGEYPEATIRWIDISPETDEALPYNTEVLNEARKTVSNLQDACPAKLPQVTSVAAINQVLRQRDLLELFNTDPDLSGFDVDISPYVRDLGPAQSHVFWREFNGPPDNDITPGRDELCPAGLGQLKDFLGKKGREGWVWDSLDGQWQRLEKSRLRPGLEVLLSAGAGGYLQDEGFVAYSTKPVAVVDIPCDERNEQYGGDSWTMLGRYVTLIEHLKDVAAEVEIIADNLNIPDTDRKLLVEAGRWHDVGKAHEAFQRGIQGDDVPDREVLWAKSTARGIPNYHVLTDDGEHLSRRGFRHELASMLAWLEHGGDDEYTDLIAYLIAAHHGKVRMGLRALPTENEPPQLSIGERLFARGVWQDDVLPAVRLNGTSIPETRLRLDLMRLGQGDQGPSWTERTRRLLDNHGPFRLAWLETLVRIADWRASEKEQNREAGNDS